MFVVSRAGFELLTWGPRVGTPSTEWGGPCCSDVTYGAYGGACMDIKTGINRQATDLTRGRGYKCMLIVLYLKPKRVNLPGVY